MLNKQKDLKYFIHKENIDKYQRAQLLINLDRPKL